MSIVQVVIIGFVLVFLMLILITGVLFLLPQVLRLFGLTGPAKSSVKKEKKGQAAPSESQPAAETVSDRNSDEIIAAIIAAITAGEEAEGVPYGNFRVVSFRRVGHINR